MIRQLFVFVFLCMLIYSTQAFAASALQVVENRIGDALWKDSSTWGFTKMHGNVSVTDVQEKDGRLIAKGSFQYKNYFGSIGTRYFDATLKKILDDVTVVEMCWPYESGTYCINR